jgi:hypothetical protein
MSQAELAVDIERLSREMEQREHDYSLGKITLEERQLAHEASKQKLVELRRRVIEEQDEFESDSNVEQDQTTPARRNLATACLDAAAILNSEGDASRSPQPGPLLNAMLGRR